MMLVPLLLAVDTAVPDVLAPPRGGPRLDLTDTLLVLGAIVVIAALLFFWAFYIRKRPSDKNGIPGLVERRSRSRRSEPPDGSSADGHRVKVRRRRRRHHPENFPRNPTLGETGGLPPVRPDESAEPPPQTP